MTEATGLGPLETALPPAAAAGVEARARLPGWAVQVVRFLFVGGLAFLIDWALLRAFQTAGSGPYLGRAGSMAVAMCAAWAMNRTVTFRTAAAPSWREFGAYVLNSLAGAAINYGLYAALVAAGAPPLAGLVVGTGVAAVFNFLRYRAILGG